MDFDAVVDSSVVLAVIREEPGGDKMKALLRRSLMCAVNVCEVAGKLFEDRFSESEVRTIFDSLGFSTAEDDFELALIAGAMRPGTRHLGLSLGDRLCLALGRRTGLPVYTADRRWAELSGSMDIRLIR